jgi:hypothetical protein
MPSAALLAQLFGFACQRFELPETAEGSKLAADFKAELQVVDGLSQLLEPRPPSRAIAPRAKRESRDARGLFSQVGTERESMCARKAGDGLLDVNEYALGELHDRRDLGGHGSLQMTKVNH